MPIPLFIRATDISSDFGKLTDTLTSERTASLYNDIYDVESIHIIDESYQNHIRFRTNTKSKIPKGRYSASQSPRFVKDTFAQTLVNRLDNHSDEQQKFFIELGKFLDGCDPESAETLDKTFCKNLKRTINKNTPVAAKEKYRKILTAENIYRAINDEDEVELATPIFWQALEESLPTIKENPDLVESLEKLKDYAADLVYLKNNIEENLETIRTKRAAENNQESPATNPDELKILTGSERPKLSAKKESTKPRKPKKEPPPVEVVDIDEINRTMETHPHLKRG